MYIHHIHMYVCMHVCIYVYTHTYALYLSEQQLFCTSENVLFRGGWMDLLHLKQFKHLTSASKRFARGFRG